MEAVKQGGCTVGIRSKTHAVIAALKLSQAEMTASQRKVFKIDDHLGVAVSGLIADGRVLVRSMRSEALNHKFVYESALPVSRLVRDVADRHQVATARSWKRPYGVGLLVIGADATGPHLFETSPDGNFAALRAQAFGARAQAARTFLERSLDAFDGATLDALIGLALEALSESAKSAARGAKDKEKAMKEVSLSSLSSLPPLSPLLFLLPRLTATP